MIPRAPFRDLAVDAKNNAIRVRELVKKRLDGWMRQTLRFRQQFLRLWNLPGLQRPLAKIPSSSDNDHSYMHIVADKELDQKCFFS